MKSGEIDTSLDAKIIATSVLPPTLIMNDGSDNMMLRLDQVEYSSNGGDILGAGAFGVVRKAKFQGKLVAVKSLKFEGGEIIKRFHAMELFISEAKKMSQISHPRIVEFLGFVMESFSIVMEFLSEGTLADYLKRNRERSIPWSVRYWFVADIAEGMTYLHSKKDLHGKPKVEVFHQDLKPANALLLLESGLLRCKISDLGLAAIKNAATDADKAENKASLLTSYVAHQGGTYAYMAPELMKGSPKVS